jgi:hypothetical protein
MTESSIRNLNTYGLAVSELGLVILAIALWIFHGFDFSELTTTIAIIVPIFASHVALIIGYVIANRGNTLDASKVVSHEFGVLSFAFWIVLVLLIATFMLLKAFNVAFQNFEEFKVLVATAEIILGGFIGKFIEALYKN